MAIGSLKAREWPSPDPRGDVRPTPRNTLHPFIDLNQALRKRHQRDPGRASDTSPRLRGASATGPTWSGRHRRPNAALFNSFLPPKSRLPVIGG